MPASRLEGRSTVVFGGTGGLGRAVVARLVEEGAVVVVADARPPADGTGQAGVAYSVVDALDESSVEAFFAGLQPSPRAVVNLIGGFHPGQPLVDLDVAVLRRQLELNFVSAAIVTKHALRRMTEAGTGGRIVHTSSRVAVQDGHNGLAYSASKLAVVRLVEAAAAEARDAGITVNCLMPSIIDTAANRQAMPDADHARWPKPEQLAAVIAFLVSDDAELISGAAIPVYGRA